MSSSYEYGWHDPRSGVTYIDGEQPLFSGLIYVRRIVGEWQAISE